MEVARAVRVLIEEYGVTQVQIAKRYSKTQGNVSQYYSMRKLIKELADRAWAEEMSFHAAIDLAKLPTDLQLAFYHETTDNAKITQGAAHAAYSDYRRRKQADAYSPALSGISIPDGEPTAAELGPVEIVMTLEQAALLADSGRVLGVEYGGRVYNIIAAEEI
jgi:predicted transcriptional regulator